jgi:hypothetical protein
MSLAVRLMRLGAILAVLGLFIPLLQIDEIRDQIEEDNPSFTSDEVDAAVTGGIVFVVVIQLAAAGLWLWMASANGQGKTWARTTATVLGGLNVLLIVIGLAAGNSTALSIVVSLVTLALAVTILVLLYKPESSRFYDLRSGRVGY